MGTPAASSFSGDYELQRLLGSGSFGEVYACTHRKTGCEYACKVMHPRVASAAALVGLRQEAMLMQALKGRNAGIAELHEVREEKLTSARLEGAVILVMEMCRGGDLFDLLRKHGRLPEPAAKFLFWQIASALHTCHSAGVMHRDIKPENILLDKPALELYSMTSSSSKPAEVHAKLTDFGCAIALPDRQTTTGTVGSRQYLAPEVVRGNAYGKKADVWSLGVVLYAMLSGRLPFSAVEDPAELRGAILRARVSFAHAVWRSVSEDAKDLVVWMLQANPQRRPSSAELFLHPWLQFDASKLPLLPLTPLTEGDARDSMVFALPVH